MDQSRRSFLESHETHEQHKKSSKFHLEDDYSINNHHRPASQGKKNNSIKEGNLLKNPGKQKHWILTYFTEKIYCLSTWASCYPDSSNIFCVLPNSVREYFIHDITNFRQFLLSFRKWKTTKLIYILSYLDNTKLNLCNFILNKLQIFRLRLVKQLFEYRWSWSERSEAPLPWLPSR